ncbi:ArsR family transcriptional regulator [Halobacterium zhouii]|uniref:ArsR family transcriptional regulator n=1 Tax=Halobacterium zhouii TaxID=2902624 RepID=UPI001E4FDB3F|nr:ArsR family transcriptional regulator [Halobacterium zhouii]
MARIELASWMTPVDRDILERLQNSGNRELVLTPRLIAENSDWSRDAVRSHVLHLRENSLIEYYDEEAGIYRLSERGRAWLQGDLPTEDLED